MSETRQAQLSDMIKSGHRHIVLIAVRGKVVRLSRCKRGCRVIQDVFGANALFHPVENNRLLEELHGHVRSLCACPHGNFVIQKVIETFPNAVVGFIAEELADVSYSIAVHKFGCRILCRMNEHLPADHWLFNRLLEDHLDQLILSWYGHYVIRSMISHGTQDQKQMIVRALMRAPHFYAQHRRGAFVMAEALDTCDKETVCGLVEKYCATLGDAPEATAGQGTEAYVAGKMRKLASAYGCS